MPRNVPDVFILLDNFFFLLAAHSIWSSWPGIRSKLELWLSCSCSQCWFLKLSRAGDWTYVPAAAEILFIPLCHSENSFCQIIFEKPKKIIEIDMHICYFSFFFFFFFFFFRAASMAYGGSQAKGWIGATVADLHHSSRQCQILNLLSDARDWTRNWWFLVGFVSAAPQSELLHICYF